MTKVIDILNSRLIELAKALLAIDWDYKLASYVWKSTSKPVANSVMLSWGNSYNNVVRERIGLLTEKFIDGSLTLEQWQQRMAIEIKDGWIVSSNIGRGGREMMTQADWGRTGGRLQYEYARLNNFAQEIELGNLSDKQILARAQLYANANRVGYYDGLTSAKMAAGYTHEQRLLNPAEHCDSCVEYAAMGIVPIGSLPEPGEASECGRNCKCTKVYYTAEDLEKMEKLDVKYIGEIEGEIRSQKYETAVIYDERGNIAFRKDGSESQVGFTKGEVDKMKDGILTHNHPHSTSFSYDDIEMVRFAGLKEIRAVGEQYTYSFVPSRSLSGMREDVLARQYGIATRDAQRAVTAKGFTDMVEANMYGTHWCMTRLAELSGSEYIRLPVQ